MTTDLHNFNLFAKLMALHRQILFNLAIAAVAEVQEDMTDVDG